MHGTTGRHERQAYVDKGRGWFFTESHKPVLEVEATFGIQ
jgi:hypothetical protein